MSVNSLNNQCHENLPMEGTFFSFPHAIEKRTDKIMRQSMKGMRKMGIPQEIASTVSVVFNLKDITPHPNVKLSANGIILEIPLLFLIRAKDLTSDTEVGEWFKAHLQQSILSEKNIMNLQAFNAILQRPKLAEEARQFVLYHELSHILNDDISHPKVSKIESRRREALADLTAAKYSSAVAGGIYLFEIMSQVSPKAHSSEDDTHPSFSERVAYLKKYKEYTDFYHDVDSDPID